jgi:hypothetical protein
MVSSAAGRASVGADSATRFQRAASSEAHRQQAPNRSSRTARILRPRYSSNRLRRAPTTSAPAPIPTRYFSIDP